MRRSQRRAVIAAILAGLAAPGGLRAADEDVPGAVEPPPPVAQDPIARFTIGLLVGTGYGWSKGAGDVNADVQFSGGSRAGLGHLIIEGGVLFPRVRLFVLTGPRLQIITGNTELYTGSFLVYRTHSYAPAWFAKFGWLPRGPEARLQPYLLVSSGYGEVVHLTEMGLAANCGPMRNERCVDTITSGPLFIGAGAGLRYRMARHLDAILALEAQLGAPDRTYNVDLNLGLAFVL